MSTTTTGIPTTTARPITTTSLPTKEIIFTNFNRVFNDNNLNQTIYGGILTYINFKGKITDLFINTSSINILKYNIYVLDLLNNVIFTQEITTGDIKINMNTSVVPDYKITLKIPKNTILNVKTLSGIIESFDTTTPIVDPVSPPNENNILLYLKYALIAILILYFIISLIKRKFKIF
jgi:hypothetical protein